MLPSDRYCDCVKTGLGVHATSYRTASGSERIMDSTGVAAFHRYRSGFCNMSSLRASLPKCFRRLQNLFRPGSHPVILSQVCPAHSAGRIQQKLRGPGDILPVDSLTGVNKVVAANGFHFRIRQKSEGVAGFLTKVARYFGRVVTDRNRTNACFVEFSQTLLDAPQLGVA